MAHELRPCLECYAAVLTAHLWVSNEQLIPFSFLPDIKKRPCVVVAFNACPVTSILSSVGARPKRT